MPFMLVDDLLNAHMKARRAGLEAMGLWVMAGSYAAQQLTDGAVPDWFVRTFPDGDVTAKRLVDVGLWHEHGHDCPDCPQPAVGEWIFHQWTAVNPTRERVLAKRAARKAAGQRGGRASAEASRQRSAETPATASDQANGAAGRTHNRSSMRQTPSPSPSSTSVVTLVALLTSAGARGVTTTTIEHWATKNTPGIDIDAETARFLEVNAGKDIHDLRAAWQAWMRAAKPAAERVTVPASKAGSIDRATLRPDDPRCDKPGHEHELASNCRLCRSEQLAAVTDDQTEERTDR